MTGTAGGNKSGDRPGNANRLKHGFYNQQLHELDGEAATGMEAELSEEIAVYRALLKKYLDLAVSAGTGEKLGPILELAGRTFARLGNLVRIQNALQGHGGDDSLDAIIARVLDDLDGNPAGPDNPENEDPENEGLDIL